MTKSNKTVEESIKEYVFCGQETQKAIGFDCGIFYFKGDVGDFLTHYTQELLDRIIEREKEIIKEKVTFPEGADMKMPYNQMLLGYSQAKQDTIDYLNQLKEELTK